MATKAETYLILSNILIFYYHDSWCRNITSEPDPTFELKTQLSKQYRFPRYLGRFRSNANVPGTFLIKRSSLANG